MCQLLNHFETNSFRVFLCIRDSALMCAAHVSFLLSVFSGAGTSKASKGKKTVVLLFSLREAHVLGTLLVLWEQSDLYCSLSFSIPCPPPDAIPINFLDVISLPNHCSRSPFFEEKKAGHSALIILKPLFLSHDKLTDSRFSTCNGEFMRAQASRASCCDLCIKFQNLLFYKWHLI